MQKVTEWGTFIGSEEELKLFEEMHRKGEKSSKDAKTDEKPVTEVKTSTKTRKAK